MHFDVDDGRCSARDGLRPLSTGRPKGHPVYVPLGEAEVESGCISPGSSPSDEGRPDAGVDAGSSGQQPNASNYMYTPCSGT